MINEALDAYLMSLPSPLLGERARVRGTESSEGATSPLPEGEGTFKSPLLGEKGTMFHENLLLRCAILDPACGSGAFPCGVMNAIMKRIDPNKTLNQSERYAKKLEILRNVIYGVDIQPMAAQIAVLRLFLSMLQEITPTRDARNNFGIAPLPNLDYKFVVANTLMGINGNDFFFHEHLDKFQQLMDLKRDFFREYNAVEKSRLKSRIESLEKELAAESGSRHIVSLCEWNHSDTVPSPYFDSRWMFGIEKFDIVIGNPPYGAAYPAEQKEYFLQKYVSAKTSDIIVNNSIVGKLKGSLDTFSLFIENGFNCLKKNGYLTFIVPLSVISSDSMTALHKLLLGHCKTIKVSSYAKRPAQIFHDSCTANTIIGFVRTNTKCEHIWTTKMNRLTERDCLSMKCSEDKDFSLDLVENIHCGNSLISDPKVAGSNAFDRHKKFPQVFQDGGFDIVIGNPPYGVAYPVEQKEYFLQKYVRGYLEMDFLFSGVLRIVAIAKSIGIFLGSESA